MITIANPGGAMMQGAQYADTIRQAQTGNKLAQLYAQQGAGIANGDPAALNALAAIDPTQALGMRQNLLGMQATQQNMAFDAEKMQMLREQAKAAAAEHAAQMTAEQRKAEADKVDMILSGAAAFYTKRDEQGYNAFLQQQGVDPSKYPFQSFPAYAAMAGGALDAMKSFDAMKPTLPEFRPATPEEAGQYGAAGGQINIRTGEFKPISPPSNGITITNPDGSTTQIGGPAKSAKPLTEAEGKNSGYLLRMKAAQDILNRTETQGTDLMASIMANDPTGLANYAQTPEFQQYSQAKRDFVNAILRRESGAVISPSEFANAEQQYFPVPGDGPEMIAQKRQAREAAIAGVAIGSGQGVNNPVVAGPEGIDNAATMDFSKMDVIQMSGINISTLTPEQRAAMSARLKELGF